MPVVSLCVCSIRLVCFFNDTATTEIYTYGHTLSLHAALPIFCRLSLLRDALAFFGAVVRLLALRVRFRLGSRQRDGDADGRGRSEEHTSELQSLMRISYAVFCLKKKQTNKALAYADDN